MKKENHRLENELKEKEREAGNYEKLVTKINEIIRKVDENQNWTYDHNVIKNNPIFRAMEISSPLYELLAKLKSAIETKKSDEHHKKTVREE